MTDGAVNLRAWPFASFRRDPNVTADGAEPMQVIGSHPSKSSYNDMADALALRILFIGGNCRLELVGGQSGTGRMTALYAELGTPEKLNYSELRKEQPYGNRCMETNYSFVDSPCSLVFLNTIVEGRLLFTPHVAASAAPPPDHSRIHNHWFSVLFAAAFTQRC